MPPEIRSISINEFIDPSGLRTAVSANDTFERIEERFENLHGRNVALMTIKYRDRQFRVKVRMRGQRVDSEGPRYDYRLTNDEVSRLIGGISTHSHALANGEELMVQYNSLNARWHVTPTNVNGIADHISTLAEQGQPTPNPEPLPSVTRNRAVLDIDEYAALPEEVRQQIEYANEDRRTAQVQFRNTQSTLRRAQARIIDLEGVVANENSLNARLQRKIENDERTIERQAATLRTMEGVNAHHESMLVTTDTLRQTAAIWRDAANGTPAKLKAFKNFCAALDSLPAAMDEQ